MGNVVRVTSELARIATLPRRNVPGGDVRAWAESLVPEMTELLSRSDRCSGEPSGPHGLCDVCGVPMRLRPAQALALHDIGTCGGAFCPLGVGEGKTLITLLAPHVLGAKRPLLLLPANLIMKTNRDRETLSKHWLIPTNIRLFSYEMLGREQSAQELDIYQPDLIVADEVHKLKNRRAAVTRRVTRWMNAH